MSDILDTLGSTITKLGAPLLGSVLGGQFGIVGGVILDAVTKAFGGTSPNDLVNKIQSDPDAATKLAAIESNNRVELERIASQNSQAEIADRQNARQLQSQKLTQNYKDPMYPILAVAITVGFFACLICLYFVHQDSPFRDAICMMIGVLAANFKDVYNYYFGSSKSSANKDDYIRSMNK